MGITFQITDLLVSTQEKIICLLCAQLLALVLRNYSEYPSPFTRAALAKNCIIAPRTELRLRPRRDPQFLAQLAPCSMG